MRVYLAVALLMLAFVAYTEAQDVEQEQTIEQKFSNFGDQIAEMSKKVAEKAKAAFQDIHNSQFATESRSWIEEQAEKIKAQFNK